MPSQPRVSLIMFAYQQELYISDAVDAALAQDYGNLQIVLSDDTSSDATFSIIKQKVAEYKGPHDITVNRNPHNLGIAGHFSKVMNELVDGELVVASAGDDCSDSNRVSRIVDQWLTHDKPDLIAHNLREINAQGEPLNGSRTTQYKWQVDTSKLGNDEALSRYLSDPFPLPFIGAALAYTKALYDSFGSPLFAAPYEDHLMYFRALLGGRVHYFNETLVSYRIHSSNFTNRTKPQQAKLQNEQVGNFGLKLPGSAIGSLRLHFLCCQQFEDYCQAVRSGKYQLNIELALRLLQNIAARHQQLVFNYGSFSAKSKLLLSKACDFLKSLSTLLLETKPHRSAAIPYLRKMNLIIFGASAAGQRTLNQLPKQFNITAFSDNNQKLHGKTIQKIPVKRPTELPQILQSQPISSIAGDTVLISSIYFYDIQAQLVDQLGIPVNKVARSPHALIIHDSFSRLAHTATRLLLGAAVVGVTALLVVF